MSTEPMCRIRLEGQGLLLEREIPCDLSERIVMLVLSRTMSQSPDALQQGAGISDDEGRGLEALSLHTGDITSSIREYIDTHHAKRMPDKITAIGLYLKDHANQPVFTRRDVLRALEAAAEPAPRNLARDVKWALRIGWIAERFEQRGTYYVTNNGRHAVESLFPDDLVKRTRTTVSTQPGRAAASASHVSRRTPEQSSPSDFA